MNNVLISDLVIFGVQERETENTEASVYKFCWCPVQTAVLGFQNLVGQNFNLKIERN